MLMDVAIVIMMSIDIKSMRGTRTTIAKNVSVSDAENIIVIADRTGKIIFRIGPIGHTFISVFVRMITVIDTDAGIRGTIAMIAIITDTGIMDTSTMVKSVVNVVKVTESVFS